MLQGFLLFWKVRKRSSDKCWYWSQMLQLPISFCSQQKFLDLSGQCFRPERNPSLPCSTAAILTPQSNLSWLPINWEVCFFTCFSICRGIPKGPADGPRFTFYDIFCFLFARSVSFLKCLMCKLVCKWKHTLPFWPWVFFFLPPRVCCCFLQGRSPGVECSRMLLKVSYYSTSDRSG